jgi:hypothetical protein
VSDTAIEQLVELVSTGSQTFNDSQYEAVSELLRSDWGKQNLASLKDGSESGEDNSYVSLLLAYGEARMQNLLDDANSNEKGPAARDILGNSLCTPFVLFLLLIPYRNHARAATM